MRLPEIKVSYSKGEHLPKINSLDLAIECLREVWDLPMIELQERVYALFLSPSMELLGWKMINAGTACETLLDQDLIIRLALISGAKHVIISHNHPAGSNKPSKADKSTTNELKRKMAILGLELTDHIILTSSDYYSFKEVGLV